MACRLTALSLTLLGLIVVITLPPGTASSGALPPSLPPALAANVSSIQGPLIAPASSSPANRLAWAICIAVVGEILIRLAQWRLRKAFEPVMQRDLYLDAAERVRRRRVVLGLPLLLSRMLILIVFLLIIVRYLGFDTRAEVVPVGVAVALAAVLIFWRPLRDMACGYFIMYDGLYATGDRVTIGEHTGVVTAVGLRHTRLRAPDGRETAIANSTITDVTNHSSAREMERLTRET